MAAKTMASMSPTKGMDRSLDRGGTFMLVMMGAAFCAPTCGLATRPRAHVRNVDAGTSTIRAASDIVYSGSSNLDGSRVVVGTSMVRSIQASTKDNSR